MSVEVDPLVNLLSDQSDQRPWRSRWDMVRFLMRQWPDPGPRPPQAWKLAFEAIDTYCAANAPRLPFLSRRQLAKIPYFLLLLWIVTQAAGAMHALLPAPLLAAIGIYHVIDFLRPRRNAY